MYEIANSYPKGSSEYIKAIETAVTLYPNDPVAIINASSIALDRNELDRAAGYLDKVKKDPRAFNNLAILYMLQDKSEESAVYFKLAADNGDATAKENLEKSEGMKEKMVKYYQDLEEYKKAVENAKIEQEKAFKSTVEKPSSKENID